MERTRERAFFCARKRRTAIPCAIVLAAIWAAVGPAAADDARIRIVQVMPEGLGPTLGTIHAIDGAEGVRLSPLFKGLAPGAHSAAIHANADCGPAELGGRKLAAGAAGAVFVPTKENLPDKDRDKPPPKLKPFVLTVGADGIARTSVTIPAVKLALLAKRSIVIEEGADGAGGAAVACGVIQP